MTTDQLWQELKQKHEALAENYDIKPNEMYIDVGGQLSGVTASRPIEEIPRFEEVIRSNISLENGKYNDTAPRLIREIGLDSVSEWADKMSYGYDYIHALVDKYVGDSGRLYDKVTDCFEQSKFQILEILVKDLPDNAKQALNAKINNGTVDRSVVQQQLEDFLKNTFVTLVFKHMDIPYSEDYVLTIGDLERGLVYPKTPEEILAIAESNKDAVESIILSN